MSQTPLSAGGQWQSDGVALPVEVNVRLNYWEFEERFPGKMVRFERSGCVRPTTSSSRFDIYIRNLIAKERNHRSFLEETRSTLEDYDGFFWLPPSPWKYLGTISGETHVILENIPTWTPLPPQSEEERAAIAEKCNTVLKKKSRPDETYDCEGAWKFFYRQVQIKKEAHCRRIEEPDHPKVEEDTGRIEPSTEREIMKKISYSLKLWKSSYKGVSRRNPFPISSMKPPGALLQANPFVPMDRVFVHREHFPLSVAQFLSRRTRWKSSHRAIYLGQFFEIVRYIFSKFGMKLDSDFVHRLDRLTKGMSCPKIKSFISFHLCVPMSAILDNPLPDNKPNLLWSDRELRTFGVTKDGYWNKFMGYVRKRHVSFAFSILMAKKYFGELCSCCLEQQSCAHKDRLTSEPIVPDEDMKAHLRKCVREIVTPDMFDNLDLYSKNIALPNRSYLGLNRSSGGLHDFIVSEQSELVELVKQKLPPEISSYILELANVDPITPYQHFVRTLAGNPSGPWKEIVKEYFETNFSQVEARYVPGPLKWRGVTINHPAHFLLKPIQMCLHKGLKKKELFQFIGKPVDSAGLQLKGELLISGDYEAATDNFCPELTRCVWDEIERIAGDRINDLLKKIARRSLEPQEILFGEDSFLQTKGQLMGQLLSFPILNIINYAGYRLNHPKKGSRERVRFNGDDILFGDNLEGAEEWERNTNKLGMIASIGKCYKHQTVCTMNSEVFRRNWRRGGRLERVPFIHSGYLRVDNDAGSCISYFVRDFSTKKATMLARDFCDLYSLFDQPRPIFGHVGNGGLGAILSSNISLPGVYRDRWDSFDKHLLTSRLGIRTDPVRCKRRTDDFFKDFVKFESNVAAVDRKKLTKDRAIFELARSWSGPYQIDSPVKDVANEARLRSALDTIMWNVNTQVGKEFHSSSASRVFLPSLRELDGDGPVSHLINFAKEAGPQNFISISGPARLCVGLGASE